MKKQVKGIIYMGLLAVSFLNADVLTGYAATEYESTEYESISLIQNGSFQIPQESYNFEKNEAEGIYSYKITEDNEDTIAYKQKKAQNIRANNEETIQKRKEECAKVLYDGMISLDKQIEVAQFALTTEEFKEVISDVINSNPELFYIRNGYKRSAFALSETDNTQIVDYCCGFYEYQDEQAIPNPQKEKINSLIAQVEAVKDRILSDVIVLGMSNMEKALMIHEYLVLNTQYNYGAYLEYANGGDDSGFVDSDYDIYGTLVKGQAVCQGYALSYKYLLESAGVKNIGFASNENHIWNTITLDGAGYYVDCTWDDSNWDTLGNVKHKYFLKSERNFENHVIVDKDRICNGTAYDNMFWDDVDSGIFYYRGSYYYVKDDGNLYKIKLRTSTDTKNGEDKIADLNLKTTSSWNYKNAAKIAVAGSNIIFHDISRIYCCNLRTGKTESIYEPKLSENELIYGLRYQNGTFEYSTRKQTVNGTAVQYNNEKQKIYTYVLPESLFRVSVESVTVSGPDTIRLSMKDGKYINDTITLKADILPKDASDKRIWKWTSSDTSVAVADINGKVKGLKPGLVTITAIANDGKVEGTYNLKVVFNGSIMDENGSTVYYEDGTKITNRFYQIDGKTYYLGTDGTKVTGWQKINGKQYYFREAGLYVTGWQTIDENRYYFDKDGVMLTGWQIIDGDRYYFDKNGIMLTGWQKVSGQQYYFGNKGIMVIGWNTIGTKRYYFDGKGVMVTGWKTISKKKYYFDGKGAMATGWKTIKKKKYYFSNVGVMQTGWKTIKKKKYYFDKKGVMATGWKTIKKKKYYFDKKGVMATGWKTIKKKKYYFNKKGVMQTGLKKIDGISYYFAKDGHLVS